MQPLKMVIPGRFWDSFIYKGRLFLFGLDGYVGTYKWDSLVDAWNLDDSLKIAFVCAFQHSDYLYSGDVQDLLRDREIRTLVSGKFERLADAELHATESMMRRALEGHQDSPSPFPTSDLEIYDDQMYLGSVAGLFQVGCGKRTKHPISTKTHKRWDGPILGIAASYGSIAMAAGEEGLFSTSVSRYGHGPRGSEPTQLASVSCRDCSWAFYSVFASSDSSGYLAEFRKLQDTHDPGHSMREFEGLETASEIFGSDGYSWGVQDKICQASENRIKVAKYVPWEGDAEQRIRSIGSVQFDQWKGSIVSASTANFGVIVELEHALVVFPSVGPTITIPGEPVNWRHFPRSRNYENQLHVIYEDRLEILSFNHDYLVDQELKVIGTSVFGGARRRLSDVSLLRVH